MKKKEYKERLKFLRNVNRSLDGALDQELNENDRLRRAGTVVERAVIAVAAVCTLRWVFGKK